MATDEKLHLIITSERGKTRAFSFAKRRIATVGWTVAALMLGSCLGWGFTGENIALRLQNGIYKRELAEVHEQHRQVLDQAANQEQEQRALLDSALTELRKRSEVIESILSTVGINLEVRESRSNAGGPYTSLPDDTYENLTIKVDHYLDTIQSVPLGSPVPGTISSPFGRRLDPINNRAAFHDGVDIRNQIGTKVKAPAAGVVSSRGYTDGYGNYLIIDHGNEFETKYYHLNKILVPEGVEVKRGQAIAQLGNTGRSTGAHLHYTMKYKGKSVNPYRFMQIASLMAGATAAK